MVELGIGVLTLTVANAGIVINEIRRAAETWVFKRPPTFYNLWVLRCNYAHEDRDWL